MEFQLYFKPSNAIINENENYDKFLANNIVSKHLIIEMCKVWQMKHYRTLMNVTFYQTLQKKFYIFFLVKFLNYHDSPLV